MRTRSRAFLGWPTLAIVCSATVVNAQGSLVFVPVRVSEVMSPADQQRTGVAGLTPDQRFALDTWLTRYSAELRGPVSTPLARRGVLVASAPNADGSPAIAAAGEASEPDDDGAAQGRGHRGLPWTAPLIATLGARLVATPEDGGFVRLADGTLWEVYVPDRTATVIWRAGDFVSVSRAPTAAGDYDHLLINAPARTRALARFVGLVPPRRR